ncbi:hypothetical protein B7994_09055 [Fibrobacter sp. UWR2]|nr:hypothetical protein B7994_09055 [Fibrobacter sp. UWR2]
MSPILAFFCFFVIRDKKGGHLSQFGRFSQDARKSLSINDLQFFLTILFNKTAIFCKKWRFFVSKSIIFEPITRKSKRACFCLFAKKVKMLVEVLWETVNDE